MKEDEEPERQGKLLLLVRTVETSREEADEKEKSEKEEVEMVVLERRGEEEGVKVEAHEVEEEQHK